MIASGHVDVCYWQGDHRSDHKGKLRGRRGHPKKAAAGGGLVHACGAWRGRRRRTREQSRVYVMSIRRPIIHVVTRPFAKKSSYFWHKVQSDSGNTSITHSSWTVLVLNDWGYCNLSTLAQEKEQRSVYRVKSSHCTMDIPSRAVGRSQNPRGQVVTKSL